MKRKRLLLAFLVVMAAVPLSVALSEGESAAGKLSELELNITGMV